MPRSNEHWELWQRAAKIMPSHRGHYNDWNQLARVLGLRMDEVVHHYYYAQTWDPEIYRKLKLITSSFGPTLVKKKLKELDEKCNNDKVR